MLWRGRLDQEDKRCYQPEVNASQYAQKTTKAMAHTPKYIAPGVRLCQKSRLFVVGVQDLTVTASVSMGISERRVCGEIGEGLQDLLGSGPMKIWGLHGSNLLFPFLQTRRA